MIINMKKVAAILIISLGLLAGLIAAFILFSKPDELTAVEKEKAINEMLGRKANLNPKVITGESSFDGKYAFFNYPKSAKIYDYRDPGVRNNENSLESFSFDLQSPRRIFNYTVESTNVTKLDDLPAVSLRKNKANGYTQTDQKIDRISALSFSKDRSGEYMAEKSTFFINDGKLFTISITGSSIEEVEKLQKEILKSIKLK